MGSIIWKPTSSKPGKSGTIFLVDQSKNGGQQAAPTITTPDGRTITGTYSNNEGSVAQYLFPDEVRGMSNLKLNYNGQTTTLGSGGMRYEGDSLDKMAESSGGGGGGGYGMGVGMMGQHGAYAPYIGNLFPSAVLSNYNPINPADYTKIDPMEYAKQYGDFSRSEYQKNFDQAGQMALSQLDTELQGMAGYVPAASALKRQQTSIDNIFDQYQRTQQVNQALPGVTGQLQDQASRAQAYASGSLPNSVQDRALELGVRSQAADQAAAGGFGATSSVARKASYLMSAQQRLQLSQYGDQLLTSNIGTKANLLMAPTEYSNAGQQVSVMPSVSASQLQQQNATNLANLGMVPATTALSNKIQQEQFGTNLVQSTNQFNATNMLQNSQFNANNLNNFALNKFQYDAAYASGLASAAQTDINTRVGFQQQQNYLNQLQQSISAAQASGNWAAAGQIITSLFGSGAASQILDILKKGIGGGSSSTNPPNYVEGNATTGPTNAPITTEPNYVQGGPDTGPTNAPTGPSDSMGVVPNYSTGEGSNYAYLPNATPQPSFYNEPATTPQAMTVKSLTDIHPTVQQDALAKSLAINALGTAGISQHQLPGMVHVSTDESGNKYYSSPAMMQNNDPTPAIASVQHIFKTLAPLGVFTQKDAENFKKIETAITDPVLHSKLDAARQSGDKATFIKTLQEAYL